MKCRQLLVASLLLSLLPVVSACRSADGPGDPDRPAPPRKILFVSIDTTRADHLGSYGYRRPTSPFLDSLARGGVRFANAYATMPTTDPSHTSMLTGQYPRTHGLMRNAARRSDPRAPSLGSWLQERGYTTAAITARLGLDPDLRGIRGFDHTDAPRLPDKWRDASTVTGLVRGWLRERAEDESWFLWAHLWEPHKPYDPEDPYRDRFLEPRTPGRFIDHDPPRFLGEGDKVSARVVKTSVAMYDGEIARADDALVVLAALARLAPPTGVEPLIIVVSDHGEALAERQDSTRIGFGHGATIHDEVVKVPWVMHWADVLRPQVLETPVSLVDLAPTLVDLIDPSDPLPTDGRSLLASVIDGDEPELRPVVVERRLFSTEPVPGLRHVQTAWIEYPWKLIASEGPAPPELYRLDRDPGERRDVVDEFPGHAEELGVALAGWKESRAKPRRSGAHTRIGEAEREALKSLGYID